MLILKRSAINLTYQKYIMWHNFYDIFAFLCTYVYLCMHHYNVAVRGQLTGVCSIFLLCVHLELNPGLADSILTKTSYQPGVLWTVALKYLLIFSVNPLESYLCNYQPLKLDLCFFVHNSYIKCITENDTIHLLIFDSLEVLFQPKMNWVISIYLQNRSFNLTTLLFLMFLFSVIVKAHYEIS